MFDVVSRARCGDGYTQKRYRGKKRGKEKRKVEYFIHACALYIVRVYTKETRREKKRSNRWFVLHADAGFLASVIRNKAFYTPAHRNEQQQRSSSHLSARVWHVPAYPHHRAAPYIPNAMFTRKTLDTHLFSFFFSYLYLFCPPLALVFAFLSRVIFRSIDRHGMAWHGIASHPCRARIIT